MALMLYAFLFSILFLIPTLLVLMSLFSSSKSGKNPPPSPPKLPLIGNLHQLGPHPHRTLRTMAKTYGPLMLVHFGSVPVLIASSANLAKEILKTHDLSFAGRPHLHIASKLSYGLKDIVFSAYGEYWRQVKSIAVLHLLSNKRVMSFQQARDDELAYMMEKIQKAGSSAINLSELFVSLANNLVCRVALGRRYEDAKFQKMVERTAELLGRFSVGSYIPMLWWVDHLTGLERAVDELVKEFDIFLEGVIDDHENKKRAEVEDGAEDFVDILLQLQKNHETGFHLERGMIKAIIQDVFGAGTDTTSTTLEWAISELLRHPLAMKKLQEETLNIGQGRSTITEDDLEKMEYLKAVLKETFRLHPPIPLLVPHESTQDVKLLGYDIPSGTQVLINAWAIGRDTSYWEDPEEFRPERFMNSDIDYKGFHFELIPFGAGRRGCPGIQFSKKISELVLANLVYKFDLASVGEECLDMSESSGITVHKETPLLVSASPCSWVRF